jgi:dihydropyrimidinase
MLDLVIRGGQVVTPEGVGTWDVAVEGERIVAVAAAGTLPREVGRVLDATGKLVVPGGIDPHVHTHWPIPALGGGHTTSAPKTEGRRGSQRRLEERGRYLGHNSALLSVKKSGAV